MTRQRVVWQIEYAHAYADLSIALARFECAVGGI